MWTICIGAHTSLGSAGHQNELVSGPPYWMSLLEATYHDLSFRTTWHPSSDLPSSMLGNWRNGMARNVYSSPFQVARRHPVHILCYHTMIHQRSYAGSHICWALRCHLGGRGKNSKVAGGDDQIPRPHGRSGRGSGGSRCALRDLVLGHSSVCGASRCPIYCCICVEI